MSNGEDSADESTDAVAPEEFDDRLDAVEDDLEAAATEADLDDVEATLDEIEADLDDAALVGEPTEDEEDAEDPRDSLEDRIDELRDELEEQRGPYAADVADELQRAVSTIQSSKWTDEGLEEVVETVESFYETATDTLDTSFALDAAEAEAIGADVSEAAGTIEDAGLDPDEDAEAIKTLLEAAETLSENLEDCQVFGDLEVREQLRRLGFYDVIEPEHMKDFPPELSAIKAYEVRGEVEPMLTALEKLESDFMEENILQAFEHIAPTEAYDAVQPLAQRRDPQAVRVLGRIGDERACGMLEGFLGGGDVKLESTSLQALGMIGNEDSTEAVAQRLAADNPDIRSAAARALGLIGDTRAIEPLATRLAEDDAERVRASAAWALVQIGTEDAFEEVAAYEDDRSYLVQVKAEQAAADRPTSSP